MPTGGDGDDKMNSPGHHRLLGLGHCRVAEYALQHGNATTHNHVIAHVLHYGRTLASDQGQQHGRLADAPEQEQFAWVDKRGMVER